MLVNGGPGYASHCSLDPPTSFPRCVDAGWREWKPAARRFAAGVAMVRGPPLALAHGAGRPGLLGAEQRVASAEIVTTLRATGDTGLANLAEAPSEAGEIITPWVAN
jgi:hypothetical protein